MASREHDSWDVWRDVQTGEVRLPRYRLPPRLRRRHRVRLY